MIAYHRETSIGKHVLEGEQGMSTIQCTGDSLLAVRKKFLQCMKYVDEIPPTEPLIIRVGVQSGISR